MVPLKTNSFPEGWFESNLVSQARVIKFIEELLNRLTSPFFILNNELKILHFNQASEQILKIDKKVLNKNYSTLLFSRNENVKIKNSFNELLQNKKKSITIQLNYKISGKKISFNTNLSFLKIGKSTQSGLLLVELHKPDSKESVLPEEMGGELLTKEELFSKFNTLAGLTPNLIMIFDAKKRIVFINEALRRVSKVKVGEILGKSLDSVPIPGEFVEQTKKNLHKAFDTGEIVSHEIKIRNNLWFDCTLVPEKDKNGKVVSVYGIARDLSEQKEIQKRLLQLTRNLEKQVKERTLELQEQNKVLRKEIKQRILTEKKLVEQNRLYDLVVNSSSDGILLVDFRGGIIFSNNVSAEIFGFKSVEEFNRENFFNLFTDIVRKQIKKKILGVAQKESFIREEFRMKKSDGSLFFAEVTFNPVSRESENTDTFLVMVKDVTTSRLNKIQLQASEKKYKTLFELSPNGILIQDINGNIIEANPRAAEILEIKKEDLLKKSIFDFVFPGEEEHAKENIKKILRGEKLHQTVKNFTAKGRVVILELTEQALELEKGEKYIITTMKDLTDMLSAETELFQKEALYGSLFNASPLPILLEDSKGKILKANKAAEKVFGYSAEELINKHISLLSPDKDHHKIKGDISKILNGDVLVHRVKTLFKNGEVRDFELHEVSVPLEDEEFGILVIYKDITESIEREEKLREAKELLEKTAELKENFFSQMTHEIRSPINIILNFFSLLREELDIEKNEIVKTSFEAIESAGKRILHTLENILRMSEFRADLYEPKFKIISLSEKIMPALINEYGRLCEIRGLKFNYINKSARSEIKADYFSVIQLFSNLLDNAVKYTKKGSITLSLENDSDYVTVTVEDTGIGMDEEYLSEIFEVFSRGKDVKEENIEGTGLGMALVQKYCQLNNCEIKIESKKGKGSKFTVKFPLARKK